MNKDTTVTEKRRERLAGHLSRKHQVAATQAFVQIARREISGLPDRIRFAVAAISEFERLDADDKIKKLSDQVESLKLENIKLKAALVAYKGRAAEPLVLAPPAPVPEKAPTPATEGQMVRAVPEIDDDHLGKF